MDGANADTQIVEKFLAFYWNPQISFTIVKRPHK